jgi:hypothetical protein
MKQQIREKPIEFNQNARSKGHPNSSQNWGRGQKS